MKTQSSNKAVWKDFLANIEVPVFRLSFMDSPTVTEVKAEQPKSMAGHYFGGIAAKTQKPTGFQAAIPNYIQQKVNRR